MAGIFNNLDQMISKIGESFAKIVPQNDPFPTAQLGGGDPFGQMGLGGGGDPFGGAGFGGAGGDPFGGFQQNQQDPFPQAQIGGRDPFGSFNLSNNDPFGNFAMGNSNPFGSFGMPGDPWAGKIQTSPNVPDAATQAYNQGKAQGNQQNGSSWLGTGTGSDNATLTADKVNGYIASRPGSPLAGMGDFILKEANAKGVSVPQLLGIMTLESGLGTENGTLPGVFNYGGLTGTGWGGQTGNTTGMAREFATFATKEDGIRALIANLATDKYRGKSVQQQIGTWYLGDPNAGLDAADEKGNATMRQYLNTIAGVYTALGLTPNLAAPPTAGATQGNVPITTTGFTFPVVGYGQANVPLHWGSEHGGADIFAPEGTSVVSMGSGTVIDAGPNGLGGNTVTLRLDNGLIVYMAHLRDAPLVRAGQKVQAGSQLGFVGQTGNAAGTGAHLHIGIGRDIINGGGPTGGLGDGFGGGGESFDANGWLNSILTQTRGGR